MDESKPCACVCCEMHRAVVVAGMFVLSNTYTEDLKHAAVNKSLYLALWYSDDTFIEVSVKNTVENHNTLFASDRSST